MQDALILAKSAAQGVYINAHCSVYTETSFLSAFSDLASLGLISFRCEEFFPTLPTANEFIVSLLKDESGDCDGLSASYLEVLARIVAS